jgi:hypothetical protein
MTIANIHTNQKAHQHKHAAQNAAIRTNDSSCSIPQQLHELAMSLAAG